MKGIILAGGKGTRLYPMTISVSKQILPIYDKPMIYYPLSVLLMSGIREILIISTPRDIKCYEELLGNGLKLGIKIEYKIQEKATGIGEAFILGEEFIGSDSVCLVLGDNVFFGQAFKDILKKAANIKEGGYIFAYPIDNPVDFGVVEFDENYNVISLEEKPEKPKSNYAIPGLYFYDNKVVEIAKNLKPSDRGELEITDINQEYLKKQKLKAIPLGRGFAWLDTGTPSGMLKASNFVSTVQERQGMYISCIEEIAWREGFITDKQLEAIGNELQKVQYGQYLLNLLKRK
jgi:glucose-1-phosphate thymidylyltransferase